ncbi:LamG domain-containing protein [Paenibacillus sp. L3-i20]|uniref:LamG domain-containing protein n=1 Tax=Paenibacillus sp. L3-i20 TaxID=2905833 RepID=UPI0020885A2D|nr:LamG domain-containing protein [Paenibacillus sp. L3-i20]GKU80178.1 hypothetical protein L3i20_v245750 [Paenibacillus sp. L3-i20]
MITGRIPGEYTNLLLRDQLNSTNHRINFKVDAGYQLNIVFFGKNLTTMADVYITLSKSVDTILDSSRHCHIVVVSDDSYLSLYIDNVLKKQVACGSNISFDSSGTKPLILGGTSGGGLNVNLKNAAYYNRALSSAERTQNFNALK